MQQRIFPSTAGRGQDDTGEMGVDGIEQPMAAEMNNVGAGGFASVVGLGGFHSQEAPSMGEEPTDCLDFALGSREMPVAACRAIG